MDYEAELLKSLSREQLESEVAEKISQFHGLLTCEVAMRLIAKEKGIANEEEKKVTVAGIPKEGRRLTLECSVRKVWPVAKYSSGKQSRVVELSDGTGAIPLVLWNDDVKLGNGLRARDRVLVRGAYEKGGELHLGFSGTVSTLEKARFSSLDSLPKGEFSHVTGYVPAIAGLDRYVSGTSAKPGFAFTLTDGKNEIQVVIWGKPDRGQSLQIGDEVVLEDALENGGRLELSADARLLVRRKERMLLGAVNSMEASDAGAAGGILVVRVDGKEASFDRENALKFLGCEIAPDIALTTVATLKRNSVLNSRIAVKVREKEGRMLVEG